ncbi:MAG: carbohydrate binding domain-containing protein, partial [Acholeplasmataceae bacterium]
KHTITTEWTTQSFVFTMDLDNQKGGILFGLGLVNGVAVNATMWFDNFEITEVSPDSDETAPILSGVSDTRSILVDAEFDALSGVKALDLIDGDISEDVTYVITDEDNNVIDELDTSAPGTFTVTYSAEDSAGNVATKEMILEIVGMQFSDTNLIVNPSFEAALDEETPEWGVWSQDWGTPPVVVSAIDTENGVYTMDITGGGDAAWAVQLFQDGLSLVEGKTYRLSVTVQSEVTRKMNIALGYGEPYITYARFDAVDLKTTEETVEFVFTVENVSHDVKLTFELGSQDGFADGLVTFSEVKLQEAILEDVITNGTIEDGWTVWYQNWGDMPTVTYDRTGGTFNVETDKSGEANWAIQFNQTMINLEAEKTYVLTFDAMASVARDINVKLMVPVTYFNVLEQLGVMLTTEMDTYTYEFTTTTENISGLTLSFELGLTASFAAGKVSFDNISIVEKDVTDAPNLIINGDATTVPSFNYDNSGSAAGTMVLDENGDAVINVTTLGSDPWTPHFYQMIDSIAPGNYVLKIVIDSSVDRDLRVNLVLPNAGWGSILPDGSVDFAVFAAETNTIYVEFTVSSEVTDVKLELDFGTLGGELVSEVGTFTISEVYIYQNLN